jgi:hypothetical protein
LPVAFSVKLCYIIIIREAQEREESMIIAVSGIIRNNLNEQNQTQYQRKFYQPQTALELKEDIKTDFDNVLTKEVSKLKIDIFI